MRHPNEFTCLNLFSGAGGFTLGLAIRRTTQFKRDAK